MTGWISLYVERLNLAMLDEFDVAKIGHVSRAGAACFNAARNAGRCETRALALTGVRANLAGVGGFEIAGFGLARIWEAERCPVAALCAALGFRSRNWRLCDGCYRPLTSACADQ